MNLFILAIIATVILHKLYSLLGKSDSENTNVNFTKYSGKPDIIDVTPSPEERLRNLIAQETEEADEKLKPFIEQILKIDASFSQKTFLKSAQKAFEMIVKAYNSGDRETLKMLLSNNVYSTFKKAIEEREKRKELAEFTLVSFKSINILDVSMHNKIIFIKLKFLTEQINILKDSNNNIISGSASNITIVEDNWCFSRDLTSKSPAWQLSEVNA